MRLSTVLVTLLIVGWACGGVVDATVSEAGPPDATTSDVDISDASNVDVKPPQTYYDFADPARWSIGVSGSMVGSDADSDRAYGGAFDGRYVYELVALVGSSLRLRRYDTKLPFSSPSSWDEFSLSPAYGIFLGLVATPTHVYLIPSSYYYQQTPPMLVRYAIGADFHNPTSFETHVLGVQNPIAAQFASGGVFDGRYLYFNDGIVGKVARYDTTAGFNAPTSYEYSNCSPPAETPYAAWGFGSFDGRFVYFVRHDSVGSAFRYDTTQPFSTSCEVYRIHLGGTLLNAMPIDDPETVVFDGKRIYVANAGSAPAVAIGQYDLTKPFADRSSWDELDVPKARARRGATFDGRYVYFASTSWVAPFDIARYDTTKDFADPKSWEVADLEKVAAIKLSHGCSGLVFDGEYVYCVGQDIRFHARSQSGALGFQASFY